MREASKRGGSAERSALHAVSWNAIYYHAGAAHISCLLPQMSATSLARQLTHPSADDASIKECVNRGSLAPWFPTLRRHRTSRRRTRLYVDLSQYSPQLLLSHG